MDKVFVPPIKCQGIKTKLVPWILDQVRLPEGGRWIEPFMGSGVVGFNLRPRRALFADKNPHLISFYLAIQSGDITPAKAREFLHEEGERLVRDGATHYKAVRERFNKLGRPLDFLFLNRSCFNGIIRFNSRGGFNTPYGHKPERFRQAYITKIANQIDYVARAMSAGQWEFVCADFRELVAGAARGDLIYCDPPYLGRHVDYFDSWSETDESDLAAALHSSKAQFILSTWHSNQHRDNTSLQQHWRDCPTLTREHFYHVGAREANRKPMLEALVLNFVSARESKPAPRKGRVDQLPLFASAA